MESAGAPIVPPEGCDYLAAMKISMIGSDIWGLVLAWAPLKLVGATGSPGNPVATW